MNRKDIIFYSFLAIYAILALSFRLSIWCFFIPLGLLIIAKYTIHPFAKWLEKPIKFK